MHILQTSIQYVKGIGPNKANQLLRLKLRTVEDLLYYFPARYEDRSHFKTIKELIPSEYCTIKGAVKDIAVKSAYHKRGFNITEALIYDDTGCIIATWFNQPYIKNLFKKDDEAIFYGKPDIYKGRLQLVCPEYEILSKEDDPSLHIGRIVPIYPLSERITQRFLRAVIHNALSSFSYRIVDMLPQDIRKAWHLIDLPGALRMVHFPDDEAHLNKAKRRLAFDEMFLFNLGLALRRHLIKEKTKGISHKTAGALIDTFKASLPFCMTKAQENAVCEIFQDMASPAPMQRCLCGEVGSGKTLVATFACLAAVESGYQVAFMVPTEILAEQHYNTLKNLLKPLDVEVACLTSSTDPENKTLIRHSISCGNIKIIVGTHALIQRNIRFNNLGLIIIDEQHKFGVLQRLRLRLKGTHPDVLFMSATPIPRTLALTLYGDLDITTMDELPEGRGDVTTRVLTYNMRSIGWDCIIKEVKEGRQAYIIYPLVLESDRLELRAATQMYKKLSQEVFKDFNVGLLHGQLEPISRKKIMQDFKDKKIDILVATSVVEVGVDIVNATIMLIEHAERFGLCQLHQLRGRVLRSRHPATCILMTDTKDDACLERLNFFASTQDGIKIAEKDLMLRGAGEVFGTKQSGIPAFKLANPITDSKLLEESRQAAFELVKTDPSLSNISNRWLKLKAKRHFKEMDFHIVGA